MDARELVSGVGAAPADLPGPHRYLPYYGLDAAPFRAGADPRWLWVGAAHQALLEALARAIRERDGIVLLTGDVGTGKTCLANRLGQALGEAGVVVGRMHHPGSDPADFFQTALGAFGVGRDLQTREEFLAAFQKLLDRSSASKLLLVIDEAQALSHQLLQEVRELSEVSLPGRASLTILLVGHPELAARLLEEKHAAVRRRIAAEYTLAPLRREEVASYIRHALAMAGAVQEVFSDEAVEAIASLSRGAPGSINIICDRALLLGEARRVRPVSRSIVEACCQRPGSPGPGRGRRRRASRPARLLNRGGGATTLLRRAGPRLGLAVAVPAAVVLVIGAQSLSPSTWMAGLWRNVVPPRPSPPAGGIGSTTAGIGPVDGGGRAAIAIESPRIEPPAPVTEMSPVLPAVPPPAPVPAATPPAPASAAAPAAPAPAVLPPAPAPATPAPPPASPSASAPAPPPARTVEPPSTRPAPAGVTPPVRVVPAAPPERAYRQATAPPDATRAEKSAVDARRLESPGASEGRPARPASPPAPQAREARGQDDEPDPSAIIDWLIKGTTTGN
jgi:type II secretory pathway predicted ATPase ExeA